MKSLQVLQYLKQAVTQKYLVALLLDALLRMGFVVQRNVVVFVNGFQSVRVDDWTTEHPINARNDSFDLIWYFLWKEWRGTLFLLISNAGINRCVTMWTTRLKTSVSPKLLSTSVNYAIFSVKRIEIWCPEGSFTYWLFQSNRIRRVKCT